MNNVSNPRNHPLFLAVLLNIIAIIYLYVIDLRIMQELNNTWDSELGYVMAIPFFIMVIYSWVCLAITIHLNILYSQVWAGDSEWSANVVYPRDKFSSL